MNLIFFGDFTPWNTELIILSVKVSPVLNSTLFSKFKKICITAIEIHNNQEKIAISSLLVNLKKSDKTANQCSVPVNAIFNVHVAPIVYNLVCL